eukprot:gene452-1854_t
MQFYNRPLSQPIQRSSGCATNLRAPGASQLASGFNPRFKITTARSGMRQTASLPTRQHESIPSPCAVPTSPGVADGLNSLLGCQGRNVSTATSVADIQRFKALAEEQEQLLVFDFYVPSNSMCARIHEMVEEVAAENEEVMFVKVNRLTEELRPILRQVTARRTFHIWKSGKVISKMTTSLLPEVVFPMGELRGELRRHAMAAAVAPTGGTNRCSTRHCLSTDPSSCQQGTSDIICAGLRLGPVCHKESSRTSSFSGETLCRLIKQIMFNRADMGQAC